MKSTLWTLRARDLFKGGIIAVGTPTLTLLQQLIPSWTPYLTERFGETGGLVIQGAIGATVTYLLKQLATNDVAVAERIIEKEKKVDDENKTN